LSVEQSLGGGVRGGQLTPLKQAVDLLRRRQAAGMGPAGQLPGGPFPDLYGMGEGTRLA
jgi:hypothetical protein